MLDATSLRVPSVYGALQTAAALSSVEEIELRFDGTRLLRPIELRLDNAPNRRLLIRAAGGHHDQARIVVGSLLQGIPEMALRLPQFLAVHFLLPLLQFRLVS